MAELWRASQSRDEIGAVSGGERPMPGGVRAVWVASGSCCGGDWSPGQESVAG